MEKFKLSNLRELSTEEQLRLNGGADSNVSCSACSCSSCACTKDHPTTEASNVKNEVVDGVKEGIKK